MNKKAIEFTATQLILLLIAAIVILFMAAWYSGLGKHMMDILSNLFG